jgi:nucleotide-binding universal stress UspA family protein
MNNILVGLDLSPSGRTALRWAADQARLTGRTLVAISGVPVPASLAAVGIIGRPESVMDESTIDAPYREAVGAVWDSVLPEPDWTLEFVLDDPGRALVARSAEAALLVVGTREHVGLARLVSGSVSRYCLNHAHCPTVIVPVESSFVDQDAAAADQTEQPTAAVQDRRSAR